MSLKEKLTVLSQNLETEKNNKEKAEEEELLKPTREKIKNLELSLRDLDLIKNSLEFKGDENQKDAIGMQDYAKNTNQNIEAKSSEINDLILENQEVLKKLGVENEEQLVSSPEFATDSEVIEYHKAKEQGEDLKISDTKLKERLMDLGVEFDAENFSYELAIPAIDKKIKETALELNQERIKTPEGKELVLDNLAKEFEEKTKKLKLNSISERDKSIDSDLEKKQPDYSYYFETERNNFSIEFKDEKKEVYNWHILKLIPDNFKDMEAAYGEEIAREALEKAYQNQINNIFSESDNHLEENENISDRENKISETIVNVVKAELTKRKIAQKLKEDENYKDYPDKNDPIYYLERKIEEIGREKEIANKFLQKIETLQLELSQKSEIAEENLIFKDRDLVIPSIRKAYEDLRENLSLKEKELEEKEREIARHKENQPKIFGKKTWQKELDELEKEAVIIKNQYEKLKGEDLSLLWKKAHYFMDEKSLFSSTGKIIKEYSAEGKITEIFNELKDKLTEISNTNLSPEIMSDYVEYEALEKKINN